MDETHMDHHVSDDVATFLAQLAARLRQSPKADYFLQKAVLEMIEEAARSERTRMYDALTSPAESTPVVEEEPVLVELPF